MSANDDLVERVYRSASRQVLTTLIRLLGDFATAEMDIGRTRRFESGWRKVSGQGEEVSTMKYLLLIYGDEQALTETERKDCYAESTQLAHDLHVKGPYIGANPLHPAAMATSVRVRDGKRLVTDGPFAETREQLGGYFLVEARNLDDAIAVATRIPMARKGTRPVLEISGLPA